MTTEGFFDRLMLNPRPDRNVAHIATDVLEPIDLATGNVARPARLPMMLGIGAIAITADSPAT